MDGLKCETPSAVDRNDFTSTLCVSVCLQDEGSNHQQLRLKVGNSRGKGASKEDLPHEFGWA